MRMKVLVIIDSFSFGGAENLLAVLAEASTAVNLEFHVASLAPRSQRRNALLHVLEEAGLEISFLDIPRLLHHPAIPKIAGLIKQTGAQIVHSHLGYSATLGPIAARLVGRPSVATLHHVPGDLSLRERLKERLAVTIAGRLGTLVFVSDASRNGFAERYAERPQSWRTIYNGVDLTEFSPGQGIRLPPEFGVPDTAPVVTVVAALRAPKGHEVAIRAWRRVLDHVPDAHLLIVGDGVESGRLQQSAIDNAVEARVIFAGVRGDIPTLLRASTLVALPSFTEALPTALIEAAACGRAVVASNVGGVPEVVRHQRTGLLVPPGDEACFGAAVVELLLDDARRTAMGAEARAAAEQRFDARLWASNLRDLYLELT